MAWIKVEATTPSKPEIVRIARAVGISRDEAFGKMMRFWIWLDGVSVDGRVDGLVDADVDELLSCPGIGAAIASVGWLEFDRDNCRILIPNFERHNGETAKGRALKAIRQQKWRQKRDGNVDGNVDAITSTPASTREEKRRDLRNVTLRDEFFQKHQLGGLAGIAVTPGNPGKLKADVFAALEVKHLNDPTAIASWHRQQLAAARPAMFGTLADQAVALAAAEFTRKRRNLQRPVGYFARLVSDPSTWPSLAGYLDGAAETIRHREGMNGDG